MVSRGQAGARAAGGHAPPTEVESWLFLGNTRKGRRAKVGFLQIRGSRPPWRPPTPGHGPAECAAYKHRETGHGRKRVAAAAPGDPGCSGVGLVHDLAVACRAVAFPPLGRRACGSRPGVGRGPPRPGPLRRAPPSPLRGPPPRPGRLPPPARSAVSPLRRAPAFPPRLGFLMGAGAGSSARGRSEARQAAAIGEALSGVAPRSRRLAEEIASSRLAWAGYRAGPCRGEHSATTSETPNSTVSREASIQSSAAATSQGYVLPEGKIMPNTVFVGGIDVRMDETEIRSFFARYGSVKEVKIITDRTGVSKGYGFVSFYNDVDVQKIVESQINFHGKKLKLGPAIRKQNLCTYHVQPRPLIFNPPPPPQFQSVWSSPNAETYMQPPTMMNPITQYVQAYPPYPSSPVQVITGYQLPVYNYQMPPQWPAGEQRSYVIPPAYTAVNYHCSEVDSGAEVLPNECSVHEATPASGSGPQKKSVDRSIQTVVSCLFNPENRLRNSLVTQDDYFKDKRVHHFRRSRAVLKSDHLC
ncbi:deleted in azoospermia-like [Onychomys torridus]|uniref:deleted in azoospermia-like n=1 Tax=Onychomys torridus TaxID=38674 RepID=UPI00167F531D|nr:deleted in azoospermia-like [Onychomys torridus]